MEDMVANAIRIDFASEGCQWEVPTDEDVCTKPGAGLAGEWLGVYCREHLAIWRQELERREERDRPKLSPAMQDWYLDQSRKKGQAVQ